MRYRSPPMAQNATLLGLVLAGGRGSRLGRDKGALDYHGLAQARWAHALLAGVCACAYVSVRGEQASTAPYLGLPVIADTGEAQGPAAGLLAAWQKRPDAAWLVLGVDMPLVDERFVAALVAARDPAALATAYRHEDETPEPLCAIYEPHAREALRRQPPERASLRRLIFAGPSVLVAPADAARLKSVNTAADDAFVRRRLERV